VASWLRPPLQCGLHTAPGQQPPASIAGAPAGIRVWRAYAQGIWAQAGLTPDAFFRSAWEFVDGARDGRAFKSEKLTPAKLADTAAVPPALAARLLELSGAVLSGFYKPGFAEVRYVRLAFFSQRMQSSWHGDPAGCFDRYLQYFYAPVAGCHRVVQFAMSKVAADANQPVMVAVLANTDLLSGVLSLREGNGLGTGREDLLHMGMATADCAGGWQLMVQTNVQLSAEGKLRCGGLVGEEAQLACARLAPPAPPAGPAAAVATVQLETSRLISSCVSSEPGFAWWSNNWGYYGGNPLICSVWLGQTLDCILRVERAHPGLLSGYVAYTDHYRGARVEALGCDCVLPERGAVKTQADAAGDWWPRLSSTDPLNHAYQWGWYLRFPTLALRVDAVAAERPVLPLCAAWLTETLDCLLRIERAHPGRLGSLRAYSEHYRGGLVGAVGCTCMLPYYQRMTSQAKGDGDWYGHYDWAWYAARPTLVQRQADGRG